MPITITRLLGTSGDFPDLLVKTTLGCSVVALFILVPFSINNVVQARFVLALATSLVAIASAVNIWYGLRGEYGLWVNTYLLSPIATFTASYAMIRLSYTGSYWSFLVVLAYYFILPERRAWLFNALTALVTIPTAWVVLDDSSAIRFSAVLAGVSLFAFLSIREINVLHGLLTELAVSDKLTGLFNRSQLEHSLRQAIGQNRRSGVPVTLIIFDIDHFKSINDTLGHDAGDRVLKELGELLRNRVRLGDMAFRIGGEEFLVIAFNADEQKGTNIAEQLRKQVEHAALLPDRRVTISLGVSCLEDEMDVDTWVKACDEKLYRAKRDGRNRIVV